jgi:hypothetical protein
LLKRGDGERAAVMLDEARTFAQGAGLLLLARQAEQAAASPAR